MKSPIALWMEVADELSAICCVNVTRDKQRCLSRFKHEGLSFLTITLANFGRDLQRVLDQGYVDSSAFLGFERCRGLPLFLGGFLSRVFDHDDGSLLEEPCIDSIYSVRQLCYLASKIDLPCSVERTEGAFDAYLKCESEMKENPISEELLHKFGKMSARLFASIFSSLDRQVYYSELVPAHGPGSTADARRANDKYRLNEWTDRLEQYFPYGDYCVPNQRYADEVLDVHFREPGAEIPVKVITVPKTLKTPRIIAMEPFVMQYAQQAISRELYAQISRDLVLGELIGLTDQEPNRLMAQQGSRDGSLATLD